MTTNKYWLFLEELRKSGATNCLLQLLNLMEEFDLSSSDAREILVDWMNNYNEEDYK